MATAHVITTVPSKTNPSKSYEIRRGKDGVIYCTCPSWRYQRLGKGETRTCKHLAAFFAANLSNPEAVGVTKSECGHHLSKHQERVALRKSRAKAAYAAKKAAAAL